MLSVVWVYIADGAESDSIDVSIALAKQNLVGVDNFVVCGDWPPRWDGEFIDCPRITKHQYTELTGQSMHRRWRKYVDSIHKLNAIIASPAVGEDFLWMYDDTFIVRPVTFAELAVPRHGGTATISSQPVRRKNWREAKRRTFDCLARRGLPVKDYSTHAPTVFNKTRLTQTIAEFECLTRPRVIESLYLNHWYPTSERLTSDFFRYITCCNRKANLPTVINIGNGYYEKHRARLWECLKP